MNTYGPRMEGEARDADRAGSQQSALLIAKTIPIRVDNSTLATFSENKSDPAPIGVDVKVCWGSIL